MTASLHRLVYYSRNRIAEPSEQALATLRAILDASRTHNARCGVTGALMFNSGCFAQVLEGPLGHVEETFERIQQDERHGDVSLLALDPVADRSFPNWSMGFVGASLEDAERFETLGRQSDFDPARLTGERLHEILCELALEREGA
jgi:hypothetical protein